MVKFTIKGHVRLLQCVTWVYNRGPWLCTMCFDIFTFYLRIFEFCASSFFIICHLVAEKNIYIYVHTFHYFSLSYFIEKLTVSILVWCYKTNNSKNDIISTVGRSNALKCPKSAEKKKNSCFSAVAHCRS